MEKRLYRSRTERKLWGVCGGLGKYFNMDPTIFRIIFIAALIVGIFPTILAYIIITIIVPLEPISTIPPTIQKT